VTRIKILHGNIMKGEYMGEPDMVYEAFAD
jgi:hypothetical protein